MSGDLKCVLATWQQFLEEPLLTEGMLDLVNVHQKVMLFSLITSYKLSLDLLHCSGVTGNVKKKSSFLGLLVLLLPVSAADGQLLPVLCTHQVLNPKFGL